MCACWSSQSHVSFCGNPHPKLLPPAGDLQTCIHANDYTVKDDCALTQSGESLGVLTDMVLYVTSDPVRHLLQRQAPAKPDSRPWHDPL